MWSCVFELEFEDWWDEAQINIMCISMIQTFTNNSLNRPQIKNIFSFRNKTGYQVFHA